MLMPMHGLRGPLMPPSLCTDSLCADDCSSLCPPAPSSEAPAAEGGSLCVGAKLETLRLVTLRQQESLDSARLRELPPGLELTLLDLPTSVAAPSVGSSASASAPRDGGGGARGGRLVRAHVSVGGVEGWISLATSSGAAFVRRRVFDLGREHVTRARMLLRAEEDLGSPIVAALEPGSVVKLLEFGAGSDRRARVAAAIAGGGAAVTLFGGGCDGGLCCGWATLVTASGQVQIGPGPTSPDGTPTTAAGTWRMSASSEVPSLPASDDAGGDSSGDGHGGAACDAAADEEDAEALRAAAELREHAQRRLRAALIDAATHSASAPSVQSLRHEQRLLQEAVREARAADVASDDLVAAEKRLQKLAEELRVRQRLSKAMSERDLTSLQKAVATATRLGLPEAELRVARAMLAKELLLKKSRERLVAAAEPPAGTCCDLEELRAAVAAARENGLPTEELDAYKEVLRVAEERGHAEQALLRAVEALDVAALEEAIRNGKVRRVDPVLLARAEGVFTLEHPKQEMRNQLKSFEVGADIASLASALEKARTLGLDATSPEYSYAEQLLKDERARQQAMQEINAALGEAASVDFDDLDALKEAKAGLQEAFQTAQRAGVEEGKLREVEVRRRRIHNAVEDLKGSVRVFCRVRPLSQREHGLGDTSVLVRPDSMTVQVYHGAQPSAFAFDAVFMPGTQEEVFEDCKDLVQSCLDGYNVTMFAYGQTGAGKTFTMYGGGPGSGSEGTAPRTIDELYSLIKRDSDRFEHTVVASMMELYRNELIDLLVLKPARRSGFSSSPSASQERKLNIATDHRTGVVQIDGLTEETCEDAETLMEVLARGNRQRSVASTAMNKESSRSHLLLTIRVVRVNRQTGQQVQGKILLCDLAGSERLKKSEVSGGMQKEAIEINRSLTALGDVIDALTQRRAHIPYKNHKLTQVMQDSLGGSAKTLMFVNCSPAASNADETINALKYASRAKTITNDVKRTRLKSRQNSTSTLESSM